MENQGQRRAIETTDGRIKIIAGPGTGKTYTLVQRTVNILNKGIAPKSIYVATFTVKAADELKIKIASQLDKKDKKINIDNMYIGTYNAIALRLIEENLEYTPYKKNPRMVEGEELLFIVKKMFKLYDYYEGQESHLQYYIDLLENIGVIYESNQRNWRTVARNIIDISRRHIESLKNTKILTQSNDINQRAIGKMVQKYIKGLEEINVYDFSTSQLAVYKLLDPEKPIGQKISKSIRYIMVDEYQDTNIIQEQIVERLGSFHQNICVVGDDDQSIYSFRGATVKNILRFKGEEIRLAVNYRSKKDITTRSGKFINHVQNEGNIPISRLEKDIKNHRNIKNETSVVKIINPFVLSQGKITWAQYITKIIKDMKAKNIIQDYSQVAILYRSLKNESTKDLIRCLEDQNIKIYSPNINTFYDNIEVQTVLAIMASFYEEDLNIEIRTIVKNLKYKLFQKMAANYINASGQYFMNKFNTSPTKKWIDQRKENVREKTFIELFYEILSLPKINSMVNRSQSNQYEDMKESLNFSKLSQILSEFEYIKQIFNLEGDQRTDREIIMFFKDYILAKIEETDVSYVPEEIRFPKDHISLLTIHQSKGLEFPIVITYIGDQNLKYVPKYTKYQDTIQTPENGNLDLKEKYIGDNMRLFYTSFTRAQDLLILTSAKDPNESFYNFIEDIPDYEEIEEKLQGYEISRPKESKMVKSYSYTGDYLLYNSCPRKYKFRKKLGFEIANPTNKYMAYGTLMHQTLEDINTDLKENKKIDEEKIKTYFQINKESLAKTLKQYKIDKDQEDKIIEDLKRYVKNYEKSQEKILYVEYPISQIETMQDGLQYIIKGQIDLVKEKDDYLIVEDFKTGDKEKGKENPDYKNQLLLYSSLLGKYMEKPVKIRLNFLNDENPNVDINYEKNAVTNIINKFSDTVRNISLNEFEVEEPKDQNCKTCEFKYCCETLNLGDK